MPATKTLPVSSPRILTATAHAAFVPVGIVTVLLGPMLPWLSARWGLNYSQAGSLFTDQFAASTLGVALSGLLASRRGYRFAINVGLLLMAGAVAVLPFGSRLVGWTCVAVYGFGFGVSIPAANLLVAEVNPERQSAALNLLNFSWSVGAVACPFLVAAAIRIKKLPLFLGLLGACMLVVVAGIGATMSRIAEPAADNTKKAPSSDPGPRNILLQKLWSFLNQCRTDHLFQVLCPLFFLYVGVENAVGGWVASYAKSLNKGSAALAVMTSSFFYAALMLGRWLAPLFLRTIADFKLARAGILLACLGVVGLVSTSTLPGIMVSAAVTGFGLSSVYPITVALLSRQFGAAASRVGSTMFVMASLGGASLPWLVGYCSTLFGAVRAGLLVPLAAAALMLALYFAKWKPYAIEPKNNLNLDAV